ncbi:MAG: helix-turn-helix transcriptional regulator [Acidobacteria bacterium]|nr:helix-turn-helix transcriptional regulator [Acidobacteriota bacterium]MBV9474871.1 helix-turn-helix transcriptional regulator [Acidobacteriota bacterium]
MAPRGRPRRAESDADILGAAAELLRTQRYGAITLDEIARRAGVAKTTIYRRWPSKAALVADVLRGETDLLHGDLRRVLASLIGEAQENDDTRTIVRELLGDTYDAAALVTLLLE